MVEIIKWTNFLKFLQFLYPKEEFEEEYFHYKSIHHESYKGKTVRIQKSYDGDMLCYNDKCARCGSHNQHTFKKDRIVNDKNIDISFFYFQDDPEFRCSTCLSYLITDFWWKEKNKKSHQTKRRKKHMEKGYVPKDLFDELIIDLEIFADTLDKDPLNSGFWSDPLRKIIDEYEKKKVGK